MPEEQTTESTEVVEAEVADGDGDNASDQSYDFLEETDAGDGEEAGVAEEAAQEEAPEPGTKESAPSKAQTSPPESPPAPEEAQPEAPKPAEQQEQPEAQPPKAAPATPNWAERREEWVGRLADEVYAMSDDEFANVTQDPKEFARAAAGLHMNAVEAAVTAVRDILPQYVSSLLSQQKQSTSAEEAFYAQWPKLKGQEQLISTYGVAWKQANPKATLEQKIQGIGQLVSVVLGHEAGETQPPAPPPPAPPHVGVSALGGAAAPPRVPSSAGDMWAQVDEELFQNE